MYRKGLNGLDNLVKQPTIYPACVVRRFNEWDQSPFVLHSFFILFSKNAMMLAFICVWKAFRLNCP